MFDTTVASDTTKTPEKCNTQQATVGKSWNIDLASSRLYQVYVVVTAPTTEHFGVGGGCSISPRLVVSVLPFRSNVPLSRRARF